MSAPPALRPALAHPIALLSFLVPAAAGFSPAMSHASPAQPKMAWLNGTVGFTAQCPAPTAVWTRAMPGVPFSVETGACAKGTMPRWHGGQGANLWSPSSCAPATLPGPGQLQLMRASHLRPPPGPQAGRRAMGTRTNSGSSSTVISPTHKAPGFFSISFRTHSGEGERSSDLLRQSDPSSYEGEKE